MRGAHNEAANGTILRRETHGGRLVTCFAERPADLAAMLGEAVGRAPAAEALVDGPRRFTYADLDRESARAARAFAAAGVGPGDRVALLLGNRAEFAVAFFAAMKLGAICVPLNTREPQSGVEFVLRDCGARLIVHEAELGGRLPPPEALPDLFCRIAADDAGLHLGAEADRLVPVEPGPDAPAAILYTSGTTGQPKGCVLTHVNLVSSALHFELGWSLDAQDRALMAVPVSHITGLVAILLTMVRVGGAVLMLRSFKAAAFLEVAAAESMTYTLMVPAMYNLILLQAEPCAHDLSAWRLGGYGGAPMAPATLQAIAAKLPRLQLVTAYGATETASPATLTPLNDAGVHGHTVGRAALCSEIRVADEQGVPLDAGQSGEIWIRGPQVSPGYWNRPEATEAAFVEGFWRSGDIGVLDAEGWLQLRDRKKDMINRAGYKIYPAEVEHVLMALDGVAEVAVVGRPDAVLGEKSHAFIVRRDTQLSADRVRAHCAAALSDYKVPDFITFLAEPLPRNPNGKVLKAPLRAQAAHEAAATASAPHSAQDPARRA